MKDDYIMLAIGGPSSIVLTAMSCHTIKQEMIDAWCDERVWKGAGLYAFTVTCSFSLLGTRHVHPRGSCWIFSSDFWWESGIGDLRRWWQRLDGNESHIGAEIWNATGTAICNFCKSRIWRWLGVRLWCSWRGLDGELGRELRKVQTKYWVQGLGHQPVSNWGCWDTGTGTTEVQFLQLQKFGLKWGLTNGVLKGSWI